MCYTNLDYICRILKIIEASMDEDRFDFETISYKALKISEPRWMKLLEIIIDEGFVKGLSINGDMISVDVPRITLKGLNYLESKEK